MGYVCSKSNNNDKISKSEEYYNVTEELNLFTDSSTKNQIVEIFFELKNIDDKFNGKYSINLQISDHNQFNINNENKLSSFINLGSTDEIFPIEGEINFEKPFKIPYYFEKEQILFVQVSDENIKSNVEIIMAKIMGLKNQKLKCMIENNSFSAELFIQAIIVRKIHDSFVKMKFYDIKFHKRIIKPYFIIKRNISTNRSFSPKKSVRVHTEKRNWIKVFKSEILEDHKKVNYFTEYNLKVENICEDLSDPIMVDFYDFDKNSKYIGYIYIYLEKFYSQQNITLNLICEGNDKENSELKISCDFTKIFKFLEYLQAGLEISLIIGIDFSNKNSFHDISTEKPNNYERAIKACGGILANYDTDQLFPVYGLGIVLEETEIMNPCFPINFQSNPCVFTIDGVLKIYREALRKLKIFAKSYFAPIIKQTIENAHLRKDNHIYFILMLVTDGIINDIEDTIDSIVEASFLPISVIIVGIGDNDFSSIEKLDDENYLTNSSGIECNRDMIQFVPFNKYESNEKILANEVLREIPKQIEEYFKINNIQPGGSKL